SEKKYIFLLVDDYSRYMWAYFLSTKDQAFDTFKEYKKTIENELRTTLKMLRTDRGGEFTSNEFNQFCKENGIARQLTAPYSPQQNGVVERRNRTIMSTTRCMMKATNMPQNFWAEAVRHAIYILNSVPTKALKDITPYEAIKKRKPNLETLKIFGCIAYAKVPSQHLTKLDDRSRHIDTKYHFIRECVEREDIQVEFISGEYQKADILTKALPKIRFLTMRQLIGLKDLNNICVYYCNLEQVPESIGGLSCLEELNLNGNNFTSLPESLSQLYRLELLELDGCKKLEVLPELPPSLRGIHASDCASLREVLGSSKARTYNYFLDCPNLFKNVNVDREGSISKTQCLDSSIITSQGSIHQLACCFPWAFRFPD
nr:zinc finger, CCHC-type [Tanacetum cinerariifolium]